MSKIYITTPLYYVNAKPHIGHAYTNILCDTFARFFRWTGRDVFFLTGTDEHGTKIQKTAEARGVTPKQHVDETVPHFVELWKLLGIRYDDFIRTTDDRHKEVVSLILKKLEEKGDIYKARYKGWYSVQDETFYTESQMREGLPEEVTQDLQEIEEENYFFRLSNYQDWLVDYIESHPDFIQPEIRKNETLGFLKNTLEDLCITRPRVRLEWGIDYPNSKDHVVYVWFDALINYISAIRYGVDEDRFNSHWPATVHVVGKDILRQHAVFWPIMLKSLELEMPQKVLAHGWWRMQGAKMSKSLGNVVDPVEISKIYGVDPLRYFLLREATIGVDGAFSEELLRERYRSDLANDLGNLWHRFASMLAKYFDAAIPEVSDIEKDPLYDEVCALWSKSSEFMEVYDIRSTLQSIWQVITKSNQYVEENKPWVLAKDPSKADELARVVTVLGEVLAHLAFLLSSFLPEASEKMLARMGLEDMKTCPSQESFSRLFLKAGQKVEKGDPLFLA